MTVPVQPDAPTAKRWLEEELAKGEYQRTDLLQKFWSWLESLLPDQGVGDNSQNAAGSITVALVLTALLIGLVIVLIRWRRRGTRRSSRSDASALPEAAQIGTLKAPSEHRRAAAEARRDGRFDDAIVERFRAIIAELAADGIIETTPGLTSQEAAATASTKRTEFAAAFGEAADLFDRACYAHGLTGIRPLTESDVDRLERLDEQVQAVPA